MAGFGSKGIWLASIALACPLPATAQVLDADPAPPVRELSTDRPDKTESPYTVPQGRVQVEMDFATFTRDRVGDIRTEAIGVAPVNFKLGIGHDTDLQVIVEPYVRQTIRDLGSDSSETIDGFGDVTVRLKQNLWGNDGGATAFGLMPFVKLPTNSGGVGNDKVEFGIIAPLAIGLSDSVGIGLMTEVDVVEDDDLRGYRVNFVNSATIGFSLTDLLGMYTELFTERAADWIVTGDVGFTYALADDIQLDAGVNLGITDAADDVAVFAGLSRRF